MILIIHIFYIHMTGLLTKDYIKEFGENNINKLIFVGTPHLGAPKAGKVLIEGDNFDIPWLDSKTIKKIAKNFPSIYELLPSPEYFNHAPGYIFSPSSGTPDKQSGLGYELSRSRSEEHTSELQSQFHL